MKGGEIMKLDLNKFYNSNYKDFVHKEAVEEALRMVAEIDLKDIEIDTILSITFSVDEFGENPMYVEYLDKESKKHIVRIRPAVSNEIQEILKRYVTLEQHETDKNAIYNHFERLNVPMELRSANALDEEGNREVVLNNDNSFISFQVDPEQDDAIQWLCIQNKDGSLGSQYQYMVRFVDYAKVDEVPSNAEFLEQIHQLEELVQRKSQETLQSSKEYADAQDDTLRTEITGNVTNQINETKNDVLSYLDVKVDELKEYVDNRDAEYHGLAKRYTDNAKQEAINESKAYTDSETDKTLDESKTYTDTKHSEVTQNLSEMQDDVNTNYATIQELMRNVVSLSEADQQNFDTLNERINDKATVYKKKMGVSVRYYFPQINVTTTTDGDIILEGKDETTVKLANLLNDEQLAKLKNLNDNPTGSSPDIIFNDSEEVTKLDFSSGNPDSVTVTTGTGVKMNSKFITDTQISNIVNNTAKLSGIPNAGIASYINWYPNINIDYVRLVKDGECLRAHINDKKSPSGESVGYISTYKPAKESEVSALKTVVSSIGETNPIEMSIEYNGNSLTLDNYSTYTTIGNTTMVNINCNFTAPFSSGATPILNTLNISSETLKSFPTFMMDCIVKTATNVSSYTTTTVFSNKISSLFVETPVIASNETIATTLISFSGSYIFNNTKEAENNE